MAADNVPELKMDPANLYREEIFTDRKVGTIRVMTPVKNDGSPDTSRKIIYVGETQLMTPVGALPLAFEIEAESLGNAATKFAEVAQVARSSAQSGSFRKCAARPAPRSSSPRVSRPGLADPAAGRSSFRKRTSRPRAGEKSVRRKGRKGKKNAKEEISGARVFRLSSLPFISHRSLAFFTPHLIPRPSSLAPILHT